MCQDQCISQFQRLIDTHCLPKVGEDVEQQIFYLKMKADYFRYLAEVLSNRDDAKGNR